MWNRKNITLAFFIPFFIGGAFFTYVALDYMAGLPASLKQPLDITYAIFTSFLDMGTASGLAAVTCLNLLSKAIEFRNKYRTKGNLA